MALQLFFFHLFNLPPNHSFRVGNRHDAQKFGAGLFGDGFYTIPQGRTRLKKAWGDAANAGSGSSSNWACQLRMVFGGFFLVGQGSCGRPLLLLRFGSLAEKNGIVWISISFQRPFSLLRTHEHFQTTHNPTQPKPTKPQSYIIHNIALHDNFIFSPLLACSQHSKPHHTTPIL